MTSTRETQDPTVRPPSTIVTAGLVLALWVAALLLLAGLHVLLDRTLDIQLFDRDQSLLPTVPGLLAGIPLYMATWSIVRKRHPRAAVDD
jgi:hypothetical protein